MGMRLSSWFKRLKKEMSKHIDYQVIEQNGKPAFAVVPIAEFKEMLKALNKPEDARIPHEVVKLHVVEGFTLIKAWRKFLKVSQKEMAGRLGITQPAYSQAENASPLSHRKETLENIADALGVEVDQINMDLELD